MVSPRYPLILNFLIIIFVLFLTSCVSIEREIENIKCHYTFSNVEREEDQKRIDKIIKGVARGNVEITRSTENSTENITYDFAVKNLKVLDNIHPKILYENPTAKRSDLRQVFNPGNAKLEIEYSTIGIHAAIDITVRFKITPGAQLFYKPQGQPEQDISHRVRSDGRVFLPIKIRRGQEYIYGRTVSEEVTRFIKINVYTQEVKDIDKEEYPR